MSKHKPGGGRIEFSAIKKSTIKPLPALGCPGKFFRDVIPISVRAIDCTSEHGTGNINKPGTRRRGKN
jgi:hypothetical protein